MIIARLRKEVNKRNRVWRISVIARARARVRVKGKSKPKKKPLPLAIGSRFLPGSLENAYCDDREMQAPRGPLARPSLLPPVRDSLTRIYAYRAVCTRVIGGAEIISSLQRQRAIARPVPVVHASSRLMYGRNFRVSGIRI